MDGPPSYTQCHTHPRPEDCLEHALNRETYIILKSDGMRHCLQQFLSRCKPEERAVLLGYQKYLRPLAPKPVEPSTSSTRREDNQNSVHSNVQQGPLLENSSNKPAPNPAEEPTLQPPAGEPASQPKNPGLQKSGREKPGPKKQSPKSRKPSPQVQTGKRKRARSHSVQSITSGSDDVSDTESERVSSRQRLNSSSLSRQPMRRTKDSDDIIDTETRKISPGGADNAKIQAALNVFLPTDECETIEVPSFHELGTDLMSDDITSAREPAAGSRLEKHGKTIIGFMSKSNDRKQAFAIYDRIDTLLVQFDVDMVRLSPAVFGRQGLTHQANALTEVAKSWNKPETWLKTELKKASKYMMLSEEHPSYLSELKHHGASKWWTLPQAEARKILDTFQRTRAQKSANRSWRDFLVCKRVIERLCRVDWTFSEIAESQSPIVQILSKHVDLGVLSQGQIVPLAPFQGGQNDEHNQDEHDQRRRSNVSIERHPSSLLAAKQFEAGNMLPLPQPGTNPEAEPDYTELQQCGWGFSPIPDLFSWEGEGDMFQFGEGGGVLLSHQEQDAYFLGDGLRPDSPV